jgi:hypothetical protein
MKKLLLIISLSVCSIFVSAQIEFVNIQPGTSLSGPNNVTFAPYAQVKNAGANWVTVKVKRIIVTLAPGHLSNFCFAGYCYTSNVSISPFSVDIAPGTVADSALGTLRADLNPNSADGISEISYCAYNIDDESDSACITFRYNAGPIGINELFAGSKFLSNAYPNPADHSSLVSYNLTVLKNAHIVISNMLGSALSKINLTEKTGTVELPIAALPEGVYYYTLMNDGKPLVSRRLMISHQ